MKGSIFFTIVFAIVLFTAVNAQQVYTYTPITNTMGASIQAGVALPMGDFADVAKLGVGGEGTFEYFASPQLGLDLSIGFYSFASKADQPAGGSLDIASIPLMVGGRYLLLESDFHPYLGAEAGIHFINTKLTVPLVGDQSTNDTKFGFAPMAGIRLHMPPNLDLDMNLKYNIVSSTNFLSIIVGAMVEF